MNNMARGKPIATIKNFSGMNDNGIFWLDGFRPKMYGGQSALQQASGRTFLASEKTTGFTGFTQLVTMADYSFGGGDRVVGINADNDLYSFHQFSTSLHEGKIHDFANTTGSGTDYLFFIYGPEVIQTKSGNLLFSSANHLGVGFIGQAAAGTGATAIVDSAGRDLSTLGVSTSAGSNKVYNITKKEEFTITSLSNGAATKDKMNFNAGTTTPAANDYFFVWVDNRFKFGTQSVADNHFVGQDTTIYWERPIIKWNDAYYALNGNWISKLAQDDTTWTSDILVEQHKQLPDTVQGINISYNQDKMLVIGEQQGRGLILTWDGYSPGWTSILNTEYPPSACVRYKDGWIITIGSKIYYTNGYSLEFITTITDGDQTTVTIKRKGLEIYEEKLYVVVNYVDAGRLRNGVHVYDFKTGWYYLRGYNGVGSTGNVWMIFNSFVRGYQSSSQYMLISGQDSGYATNYNYISRIYETSGKKSSAIFYIKLPQRMNVGLVELSITSRLNNYQTNIGSATISVNYGNGNKPLFHQFSSGANSTATLLKDQYGADYTASVGQLIQFANGDVGGERSYITSIASPGVQAEEWTISPALSAVPNTNTTFLRYNLYSAGSKTINNQNIDTELLYNIPGFYSDKLFLEVYVDGDYNFDITGINIY